MNLQDIKDLATQTTTKVITDAKGNKQTFVANHFDPKTFSKLIADQGVMNAGLAKYHTQVKQPPLNGHVDFLLKSKNQRIKYDYVLLPDLLETINKGLKDTGIAFVQHDATEPHNVNKYNSYKHRIEQVPGTVITISTTITAKNGWSDLEDRTILVVASQDEQDIGGAITYGRRYSLSTVFGLSGQSDKDAQQQMMEMQYNVQSVNSNNNNARNVTRHATSNQVNKVNELLDQYAHMSNKNVAAVKSDFVKKRGPISTQNTEGNLSRAITSLTAFLQAEGAKQLKAKKEAGKKKLASNKAANQSNSTSASLSNSKAPASSASATSNSTSSKASNSTK